MRPRSFIQALQRLRVGGANRGGRELHRVWWMELRARSSTKEGCLETWKVALEALRSKPGVRSVQIILNIRVIYTSRGG